MATQHDLLPDRLRALRDAIEAAARRAGRDPDGITLVAVTKSAPPSIFGALRAAGVTDVGESRVQGAAERMAGHETDFRWHLIGHLQSNKARRAMGLFDVFHGVDSIALMRRLDELAVELERDPELFLQVNVSGEPSKHGFAPDELPEALQAASALRRARLVGLMTMAPLADDPEQARPVFQELAALRERHAGSAGAEHLTQLSMGMSDDFAVAVEEGATMVRVGRSLVGGLVTDDAANESAA
ncbi:MAG: YggS family pyridoxal phosphate-dependent enzyme [Planctomycetota bacterium]